MYKKTGETPINQTTRTARWKLFGHIMRRDKNVPANQAMNTYYEKTEKTGFRGKRRTTLPTTLNADLMKLNNHNNKHLADHNYYKQMTLNNREELEHLKTLAQDRNTWRALVKSVVQAGNAGTSEEEPAKSQ